MIRVSDLTIYLKCPRMSYFTNKGNDLIQDVTSGYLESIILKELALTYGSIIDREDRLSLINMELDRILKDIRVIYRAELEDIDNLTLERAISSVRSCAGNISSNIEKHQDFYLINPVIMEQLLESSKIGLTGTPDKLIQTKDGMVPSIIKTGRIPDNGVWKNHRFQLTAYAILIEEIYGSNVAKGFVEYARYGIVREVKIKKHERRRILQVRERIKKIKQGFMPERPEDAPCETCGFNGKCDVRSSLASRLF